jgi:hypothetical protein
VLQVLVVLQEQQAAAVLVSGTVMKLDVFPIILDQAVLVL